MKPTAFAQNNQHVPPYHLPLTHSHQLTKFYGFHKYLQAYTTAFHFHYQIKLLNKKKHELLAKIIVIENSFDKNHPHSRESSETVKPKRKRRLAEQIERSYVCLQEKCAKNYGTLGSLQQHMRLKHPQMFAKEKMSKGLISKQDQSFRDSQEEDYQVKKQ